MRATFNEVMGAALSTNYTVTTSVVKKQSNGSPHRYLNIRLNIYSNKTLFAFALYLNLQKLIRFCNRSLLLLYISLSLLPPILPFRFTHWPRSKAESITNIQKKIRLKKKLFILYFSIIVIQMKNIIKQCPLTAGELQYSTSASELKKRFMRILLINLVNAFILHCWLVSCM